MRTRADHAQLDVADQSCSTRFKFVDFAGGLSRARRRGSEQDNAADQSESDYYSHQKDLIETPFFFFWKQ